MPETISTSRSRRSKAKVNYSQEQQFSDDDVFEDNIEKGAEEATPSRRRKPRKSDHTGNTNDGDVNLLNTKPVYTEKGYDPTLPPLRERFSFEPEYELDGTPKIELIVGRRPIEDAKDRTRGGGGNEELPDTHETDDSSSPSKKKKKEGEESVPQSEMEYEYLLKYKGRSYLHLEWKSAADLESMNKHAKTLYRRFLKKLAAGTEEDLEDPTFDPAYTEPGRILAEEDHEIMVELTDKELIKWEKEQKKQWTQGGEDQEENEKNKQEVTEKDVAKEAKEEAIKEDETKEEEMKEEMKEEQMRAEQIKEEAMKEEAMKEEQMKEEMIKEETMKQDGDNEIGEPGTLSIDEIRRIINKDSPYYPQIPNSTNPYRDGYITEPPKKPRASYLFFQGVYRSVYAKRYPNASLGEVMQLLGDTWRAMSETEQAPFIQLAREEAEQYEKERALMERAQRPSEMWQPLRRCKAVLDRLSNDAFATIFLHPVDTNEYPDYLDMIDCPMDLGTVRQKLEKKKYIAPESFARDVRKIWNNCKIFNMHGSAIWHVADYMSKQFERLYHAWVLDFRDRYLRWAQPGARPWELSCRSCDGKCGTSDNMMVLCDHCDAMYGINCLQPRLKKVPKGVWHCPDCALKVGKNRTVSLLSAVTEQAAKKRAEIGDAPKKQVKQKMFLVKWAGLGYEHCTWETQEDINDDAIIAEFRRLEGVTPEEPDLTEKEVSEVIRKAQTIIPDSGEVANGEGVVKMSFLKSQLYAQTRAFQFSKFGLDIPCLLGQECGPQTHVSAQSHSKQSSTGLKCSDDSIPNLYGSSQHPEEVRLCLSDLIHKVANNSALPSHPSLPPPLTGEYDVAVPVTSKGLLMNVGEINGSVAFLGYRQFSDGTKGPSETRNLIRHQGDKIIAVNGVSTIEKSFHDVISLLRESSSNSYAFMRFVDSKLGINREDLTSCGPIGKYLIHDLSQMYKQDRRRLLAKRSSLLNYSKGEEDGSDASEEPEEEDEESSGSTSDLEPDSGDEDLLIERKVKEDWDLMKARKQTESSLDGQSNTNTPTEKGLSEIRSEGYSTPDIRVDDGGEEKKSSDSLLETKSEAKITPDSKTKIQGEMLVHKQISTRYLARHLLDMDVGYSSDEGGDEDCAYFFDGVDSTFTTVHEITPASTPRPQAGNDDTIKESMKGLEANKFPVKKDDFATLGQRSQLQISVALTCKQPTADDFDNYPLQSTKQLAVLQKEADKQAQILQQQKEREEAALMALDKPKKKSTSKIEQISTITSEVVHIWSSAEDAATTLQIPLKDIKQVLKGDYDAELGDEAGGYRWRYADEDAVVTSKASTGRDSKKGKDAYLEFKDKLYDQRMPHIYKGGNKLRDYQVDGVNWLSSCFYKRHGCILADEMGLGKTVQIVSYLEHLFRVEKIHGPFLVVVPLSTVEHWRREFEGWTAMQCCVYHDRQRVWRDVLREYEWYYEGRPHTPDYLKFNVLVTTYDTLIGDFDVIGDVPFRVTVVDEAHRLRNVKGKLLECMKEISAKGTLKYGYQSRVLMTGTPLQNNTQELWTLLNFIEPGKFPSLEDFQENFGNMANREQVEALQRKISPFMLRRVKEDVAKDIPAKEETVIDVELTSIQKQYYRAIFEHNHAFLSMGNAKGAAPKLMNIQMELRKCCNHPFLLDGVEPREMEKRHDELQRNGELDNKSSEEQHAILNEYGYVLSSGKMVLLDKLLPKLRQEGHKVLIFSQMVKMLDLISDYCDFRNFRHERLDGRVRGNERQKAIDRFETEKDSFVFLLSTRAGGVGINLTAADICIIFDSDWNPQNDVQAQARCHRIGQTKDVMIYRLVTSRTFEQEMFDRASKKLGLEQAVLGTFGQDNEDDKPSSKEMEQLLKKGAYALLEDENDEMGKEFVADDIENILAKRTRTRVVEGAKTASWLNKKGLTVTKSKFASESESAGIDVDDPLFWQKVMPDFVTPEILLKKISDLETALDKPVKGKAKLRKTNGDAIETFDEDQCDNRKEENQNQAKSCLHLSRGNQKKVNEFMIDLKGVMEDIFEQEREDTLQSSEKAICQKLLLTVSVKEKLFNEEQRSTAKKLLQRLEGDRRRRCRTLEGEPLRRRGAKFACNDFTPGPSIREELLIVSSKKKRKRRSRKPKGMIDDDVEDLDADVEEHEEATQKSEMLLDDDGYKRHSDDEDDWSDVDMDIYKGSKRKVISLKEAKRRREWGAGKDAVAAAALPWPAFPRDVVNKVLGTLLDEVIRIDQSKNALFSSPVSREEFPEYYDIIKTPMDYGTMKAKLERGEYRSAQAMQKDFVQVMQNCLKFNSKDSDIVRDAREQLLIRPKLLKEAALKNNLFICDDGSIIDVRDDDAESKEKIAQKKQNVSPKKTVIKLVACNECEGCKRKSCKQCEACMSVPKRRCLQRICSNKQPKDKVLKGNVISSTQSPSNVERVPRKRGRPRKFGDDEGTKPEGNDPDVRRPRIRLRLPLSKNRKPENNIPEQESMSGKKRKGNTEDEENNIERDEGSENNGRARKRSKNNVTEPNTSTALNNGNNISPGIDSNSSVGVTRLTVTKSSVERTDKGGLLNVELLESEYSKLDGSFEAARHYFTKRGHWYLPTEINSKFKDVAKITLNKLFRLDIYSIFKEPVKEKEAPGYYDVIKNPMDFGTMKSNVDKGNYGNGSHAAASFYDDFLLVFDNCFKFNDDGGEVIDEAIRIFSLIPLTFSKACQTMMAKSGNKSKRKSKK